MIAKTIVDYFDPRKWEHLEAWRKMACRYSVDYEPDLDDAKYFLGNTILGDWADKDWPDCWGQLIRAKMADAWLEQHLGSETDEDTDAAFDAMYGCASPDKRVAGDLRVPRLRRGGGETPR